MTSKISVATLLITIFFIFKTVSFKKLTSWLSNNEHFAYQNASKYEIILERIEPAFGDDDKVVKFDTLRIQKVNRST